MNEFFREVDEEFRRDRAAQFWKRWGGVVVVGAAIVVVGVGGWRYWEYLETTRAQQQAAQFYEAGRLLEGDDRAGGRDILESLAAGEGGYAILSRFRLAASLGDGDPAAGAEAYDALADDAAVPGTMRDLARLRGALLRMDSDPDGAASALQGLAAPAGAFRHTAREALGLIAVRRGEYDRAGQWFDQIAADPETPQALRGRLEIYSSLVAAGPLEAAR